MFNEEFHFSSSILDDENDKMIISFSIFAQVNLPTKLRQNLFDKEKLNKHFCAVVDLEMG
jgi:hypothetical protein